MFHTKYLWIQLFLEQGLQISMRISLLTYRGYNASLFNYPNILIRSIRQIEQQAKYCLFSLISLLLGLFLAACSSTPHWEDQYEDIEKNIRKEYQDIAAQLANDPYTYHFELEAANLPFVYTDDPTQATATATSTAHSFILRANYDATNLAGLDEKAIADLTQKLTPLRDMANVHIHVIGHTNSTPISPTTQSLFANNQVLSETRAKEVAQHVQQILNLDEKSVTYEGVADTHPLMSEATPEGKEQNRRVEVNVNAQSVQPQVKISPPKKTDDLPDLPKNLKPWWQPLVIESLNTEHTDTWYASREDVILRAIEHSNQIKVFSDLPLIRKTSITEAEGKFDPHVFVEGMYTDIDEPIDTTLRTGREYGRFEEEEWRLKGGIRDPLTTGGEIELSQRIGVLDNNSLYLSPHDQAHARISLTFRQPLLHGAGIEYNESTIEIAKVDHEISMDEFIRQVEAHLLEIERAYWSLYLERAVLLQKKRLYDETKSVIKALEARRGLDTLESQLIEAKAVESARYADSIRYEQSVRNAEGKLIALISDPSLVMSEKFELIPITIPIEEFTEVDMAKAVALALEKRPEVKQGFKQLKSGLMRTEVTKNELLPILDFYIETYLDGLEGDSDVSGAMRNQYDPTRPSFIAGINFDMALGNRIAEIRHQRRRLEARQLINQLRTTIETILLEVQVAVREIDTAYREVKSKYQAMVAANAKLETLKARRSVITNADWQSNYLQRLLDSQSELADAEKEFLIAYIAYNIAHVNLQRAEGILLEAKQIESYEDVEDEAFDGDELPILRLRHREEEK